MFPRFLNLGTTFRRADSFTLLFIQRTTLWYSLDGLQIFYAAAGIRTPIFLSIACHFTVSFILAQLDIFMPLLTDILYLNIKVVCYVNSIEFISEARDDSLM
jgi:hypothetical protein